VREADATPFQRNHTAGELVTVIVEAAEGPDLIVDMGRTAKRRLPEARASKLGNVHIGERLRVVIKMVDRAAKGPQVIVSRADAGLVQRCSRWKCRRFTTHGADPVGGAGSRRAHESGVMSRDKDVDRWARAWA